MVRFTPTLIALCLPLLMGVSGDGSTTGNLIHNPDFLQQNSDYSLTGDAEYRYLGDPVREVAGWGVSLKSAGNLGAGSVSQMVQAIDTKAGRWFRFTFRGLPEQNFAVAPGGLWIKVEYFAGAGETGMDGKVKRIDGLIDRDRRNLSVNGDRRVGGAAVWRTYQLDLFLPFPQVDQVRLTVGFDHGAAHTTTASSFFITDFSLKHIEGAASPPAPTTQPNASGAKEPPPGTLIPLGGRWFYRAKQGETSAASHFDSENADRLFYHDDAWSTPFTGEMTAWLRAGEKDLNGNVAATDTFVPDNETIDVDATSLIIRTRGLPNHPTGKFPETGFGRNPNYIQEQKSVYYIPLDPKVNARHFITTIDNSNHALPMGPIGIAMNGIVFFNPFDMGNTDASNMMDYCCGHPNQDGQYHYHKYPICINSPWADEGTAHSPVIGWAFDGFPVYGPYESSGLLAKEVTGDNALNGFNLHWDKDRGWHYHVTPGKFPYIIGGYWGTEDPRDSQRPRPGGGAGGGPGGRMDGHPRAGGPFGNGQRGGPNGSPNGPPDGYPDGPPNGPPGGGPGEYGGGPPPP